MSQALEKISGDHGCRIVQSGETFNGPFWAFEPIGSPVTLTALSHSGKNGLSSANQDHYLGFNAGDDITGFGLIAAKYEFTSITVNQGRVKIWRNNG